MIHDELTSQQNKPSKQTNKQKQITIASTLGRIWQGAGLHQIHVSLSHGFEEVSHLVCNDTRYILVCSPVTAY